MSRPVIELKKDLIRAIGAGHPWLFDRAVGAPRKSARPGEVVTVRRRGADIAAGLYDPHSPLRVRILDLDSTASCDSDWATRLARRAVAHRLEHPGLASTDALRLIHGENDFMPGLVIDLYAGTAVALADSDSCAAFWEPRLEAVIEACQGAGVPIERVWLRRRRRQGRVVLGDPPAELVEMREGKAHFEVDVRRGQKTGMFLDHRDNRRRVGRLCEGADVLNLFGYTGAFSVLAGLGGARRVVTVDSARPAIEAAERNWSRNGLDPAAHRAVCVDSFEYLQRCRDKGERFDVVICDPPSFAPSARAKPGALASYRRLNALAIRATAPGGLLFSASCSSHVDATELRSVVAEAAATTARQVRVIGEWGPPPDHPERIGFPEGRYLSALLLAISSGSGA